MSIDNHDDDGNAKRDGNRPYDIGYGKPPKQHQFKKGQSGNPRGRKKQDKTIRSILRRISNEPITAKLPDGERRILALEFVLISLRNRAAKGDNRATSQFIDLFLMAFGIGEPDDIKHDLSQEDRELLRAALQASGGQVHDT
jgi:hypothetical protein